MTDHVRQMESSRTAGYLRWCACLTLVLAVHGGAAWALLARPDTGEPSDADPVVMMEFALPTLAAKPSSEIAPDKVEQVQAEAAPAAMAAVAEPTPEAQDVKRPQPTEAEPVEEAKAQPAPEAKPTEQQAQARAEQQLPPLPTMAEAEVALATAVPPPREVEKDEEKKPEKVEQMAPPPTPPVTASTVTTAPSAASAPNADMVRWKAQLARHIQRYKRYPEDAQRRGERGSAVVQFSVSREGRVVVATLLRGSGSRTLDDESVALLRRAEPFPRPPVNVRDHELSFTLPVVFDKR